MSGLVFVYWVIFESYRVNENFVCFCNWVSCRVDVLEIFCSGFVLLLCGVGVLVLDVLVVCFFFIVGFVLWRFILFFWFL